MNMTVLFVIFLLLLLAALGCFGVAAFSRTQPRWNLVAAGLALWVLVDVIQTLVRID